MAKDKVTVTIDPQVLANADGDAASAGMNRSEYVEKVLQDAHYRRLLAVACAPALTPADEEATQGVLNWQRDLGQSA